MLLAQARSNAKQFVHVSDDSVWFFSLVTLFAKSAPLSSTRRKLGYIAYLRLYISSYEVMQNSCLCLVLHGLL